MKQREAMLVLAAVVLAVGVSAILLASSLASTQSASSQRPGIFFSPRNSPPPARSVIEAQRDLPAPLQPILPVQRGLTDTARDAAGYLLILLGTSAALVLARDQVVSTYRASLGGWRVQLRVLGSGLAVIGVGASAAALAWIVFLGSVSTFRNGGFIGVPAALQVGLAAFSVAIVVAGLAALVGFAAASWVLLLGATLIYIAWQLPYLGAFAVVAALAYALGAVVTARLAHSADAQVARQ